MVGAHQRQQGLPCLGVLPHFTEAEAEQVVGRVEQAVVRELGEQTAVERDGLTVVGLGWLPGGRIRRIERLLVVLLRGEELVGRLLVVELGQPEHHVRRPFPVRRILAQEALEHGDGVHAPLFLLLLVRDDHRLELVVDGLELVLVRALDNGGGGLAEAGDLFGVANEIRRHLVDQLGIDGRDGPQLGRRGQRQARRGHEAEDGHAQPGATRR